MQQLTNVNFEFNVNTMRTPACAKNVKLTSTRMFKFKRKNVPIL